MLKRVRHYWVHRSRRFALSGGFSIVGLTAMSFGGCGGSDATPISKAASGSVEQPTVINLYPSQAANSAPRLVVMATGVGSLSVSMPLIFDTGSAGVTLYAQSIFPASMVSTDGFLIPSGQTSITYNGITVTNQRGTRTYGTTNLRAQNGNIGYAQLSFGDAQGKLKTAVMPLFFYFSITDVETGQQIQVPSFQQGVFGVASTVGTIALNDSAEPSGGYIGCGPDNDSTCYVVSAFKYLQYGTSVNAGFMLSPASVQSCNIAIAGSCSPAAMLTIGLNASLEAGFSSASLSCPPKGYAGPTSIAGYPVCQKTIDDTTTTVSGEATGSITGGAVFDTGTANMQVATPAGSAFPSTLPIGSSLSIATPSGFSYSFVSTASDPLATIVNSDFAGSTIIGIGYFITNYFFIDLSSSIEGWK